VFFNLCALPQDTYDALELFLKFTQTNTVNLVEREQFMKSLLTPTPIPATPELT
jgi:hypothetical protein